MAVTGSVFQTITKMRILSQYPKDVILLQHVECAFDIGC